MYVELAAKSQIVELAALRNHATLVAICSVFFAAGLRPSPRTVARPGLAQLKSPLPKSFKKFLNSCGVNQFVPVRRAASAVVHLALLAPADAKNTGKRGSASKCKGRGKVRGGAGAM